MRHFMARRMESHVFNIDNQIDCVTLLLLKRLDPVANM